MSQPWRLLLNDRGSGPFNMGVDEALLETAIRSGLPTLRLYTWSGPWLSLGYGQPRAALDEASLARAGVGVVRRSTGGRAVLHGCDLTYSVAAPADRLPAGWTSAYALISTAISNALGRLGVSVEKRREGLGARRDPKFDCFAAAARDELCVGGRKLLGNAQRRARGCILQHGSIRMSPDPDSARAAAGLEEGVATSLAELGSGASEGDLREVCVASLGELLCASFEERGLEACEGLRALQRGVDPAPDTEFLARAGRKPRPGPWADSAPQLPPVSSR